MVVELTASVEEQLRDLASQQGRNIDVLVEEALRRYLEIAAITDLDPAEVAEVQISLIDELVDVPEWMRPSSRHSM